MKLTAILVFAMLFPSAAAYVYFVWLSGAGEGEANSMVRWIYAGTKSLMLLLPVAFIFWGDRRWRPFPKNGHASSNIALGIVFGLAVAFMIIVLANRWSDSLLKGVPDRVRLKITEFGVSTPATYLAMSVFLSTIHAFLEEYYWRWFVFGRLRLMSMPFTLAATLSGIAFAGHHVFVLNEYLPGQFLNATIPFSIGIAFGGFVWAWMYERSGSLTGPWLSHLLVDAAIMAIGYRMYFLNG